MTITQWSAIVGFVVPALVAIVNREEWKPWIKAVVALAASITVGTITALLNGEFTGANWVTSIGVVFGSSQLAYHTWWKNSDIAKKIEQTVNVVSGKSRTSDTEMRSIGGVGAMTQPVEPVRDEQWVQDVFGDVGPAPSNEVVEDLDADEAPNIGRPCRGEVVDD